MLRLGAILLGLTLGFGTTLGGCLNFRKVDDAKAPGDMLGVYQVEGELEESTCGKGALGATDSWNFEVKLSRFENDLYWLNGQETIVGGIKSDGRSFLILSSVQVDLTPPGRGKAGCSVIRHDTAKGKLSDDGAEVDSFEGTLEFSYEATAKSDCSEWIGTPGAVSTLPCSLRYSLEAERSRDK